MKIDYDFDSRKDLAQKDQSMRRRHRRDSLSRVLSIVGWCVYFFIVFLASRYIVSLFLLILSRLCGFDLRNLSDLAEAVIEIILYILMIALFIVLPMRFLPKIRQRFGAELFVAKVSFCRTFFANVGLSRWPKLSDLGWAIYILPIFYIVLFGAMLIASALFGPVTMAKTQTLAFAPTADTWELWGIGLSLCFIAPVAEEILLRGFLYTKIRQHFGRAAIRNDQFADSRWGDIVTAIVVSLVFAVAHGQLNVGLMTFILSMFNSHLRRQSGVIYGGILVHMAVNFLAFSIRYLGFLHGIIDI